MPELPEAIYQHPEDYDLEHVGHTEDVEFFVVLVRRLRPRRVLELACGNGRVTLPLAEAAAQDGFDVVGLELVPEMLQAAREKSASLPPETRERLTLVEGDMRSWRAEEPFDLIVTPCSSVSHLLTLEDQLAAWRSAYENLVPGGRLVVDVVMADLGAYADSFRRPVREVVEIDRDTYDEASHTRLLRYKTTRYLAHQQRARIRFLYEKYIGMPSPSTRSAITRATSTTPANWSCSIAIPASRSKPFTETTRAAHLGPLLHNRYSSAVDPAGVRPTEGVLTRSRG